MGNDISQTPKDDLAYGRAQLYNITMGNKGSATDAQIANATVTNDALSDAKSAVSDASSKASDAVKDAASKAKAAVTSVPQLNLALSAGAGALAGGVASRMNFPVLNAAIIAVCIAVVIWYGFPSLPSEERAVYATTTVSALAIALGTSMLLRGRFTAPLQQLPPPENRCHDCAACGLQTRKYGSREALDARLAKMEARKPCH